MMIASVSATVDQSSSGKNTPTNNFLAVERCPKQPLTSFLLSSLLATSGGTGSSATPVPNYSSTQLLQQQQQQGQNSCSPTQVSKQFTAEKHVSLGSSSPSTATITATVDSMLGKRERRQLEEEQETSASSRELKRRRDAQSPPTPSSASSLSHQLEEQHQFSERQSKDHRIVSMSSPPLESQQQQQQQQQQQATISFQHNGSQQQHSYQGLFNGALVIVEGFNKPPSEKVPGGKDNRKPIQPQVIRIDLSALSEKHASLVRERTGPSASATSNTMAHSNQQQRQQQQQHYQQQSPLQQPQQYQLSSHHPLPLPSAAPAAALPSLSYMSSSCAPSQQIVVHQQANQYQSDVPHQQQPSSFPHEHLAPHEQQQQQQQSGQIVIRATLMGFKRLSVNREEMPLAVLHQVPIARATRVSATVFHYTFEALVVNFSSHNQGQKLFIRFALIDTKNDDLVLCAADSSAFETITKRGIEKQIRKMKRSSSSLPSDQQLQPVQQQQPISSNTPCPLPMLVPLALPPPSHFLAAKLVSQSSNNPVVTPLQQTPHSPVAISAVSGIPTTKAQSPSSSPSTPSVPAHQYFLPNLPGVMSSRLLQQQQMTLRREIKKEPIPATLTHSEPELPYGREDVDICMVLLSLKNQSQ